ncbi:MerR family transcriptional regulator [Nonomuraea rhodomycinica]|uniref:HTH merR-type domain-containing protein n=1 Tax=Nonomuraea rhodomycinica TaxID=1712872 RepID=A0A7Y6IYX3_9ACTN|nr:MerR family transcriptional regulator [Nonomuraea rhodomycinica]NUW45579.1 hypothetical protein [Nonomuraea rhodomycinica]
MNQLTLQDVLDRGLTMRTLNRWIAHGHLQPGRHGHGKPREWPQQELQIAALMIRLTEGGLTTGVAAIIARAHIADGGRPLIKLAHGLVIAIDTDLLKETA